MKFKLYLIASLLIITSMFTRAGVIGSPNDHMGSGHGPVINTSTFAPPAQGISDVRIKDTTYAWNTYGPYDIGAFRTNCAFSHFAFNDPIVYPGQKDRSHLHTFFGNTAGDQNLSADNILLIGNSTCPGGIANRTLYWVPSLIDTRSGTPIVPNGNEIYYKSGYNGILAYQIQPFPVGFRMVIGSMMNTPMTKPGPQTWKCIGKDPVTGTSVEHMVGKSIQNCPKGTRLWMSIAFPQCWDGRNLDSPDHKSHLSYTVQRLDRDPKDQKYGKWCPITHPIPLPEISLNVSYAINETNAPLFWQLSSDMYEPTVDWGSLTTNAGHSAHADWFNGWRPDIMNKFVKNCINGVPDGQVPSITTSKPKDCHNDLLGDGTMLTK